MRGTLAKLWHFILTTLTLPEPTWAAEGHYKIPSTVTLQVFTIGIPHMEKGKQTHETHCQPHNFPTNAEGLFTAPKCFFQASVMQVLANLPPFGSASTSWCLLPALCN